MGLIHSQRVDMRQVFWLVLHPCIMTTKVIALTSGLTSINSSVFKDALLLLVKHLVAIFKNSLLEGKFPESWSTGILVPIPKKGDLHSQY